MKNLNSQISKNTQLLLVIASVIVALAFIYVSFNAVEPVNYEAEAHSLGCNQITATTAWWCTCSDMDSDGEDDIFCSKVNWTSSGSCGVNFLGETHWDKDQCGGGGGGGSCTTNTTNYGQGSSCTSQGGTCQNSCTKSCDGDYKTGLCPGPWFWKCCVPEPEPGQQWYYCKTKQSYQCQQTSGFYATQADCEAAVETWAGPSGSDITDDYTCYSTSSACQANCIAPPNNLTVRSTIDGTLTAGASITRVSGTGGTGGTTEYTFTTSNNLSTVLRAPAFFNNAEFNRWVGCNSVGGTDNRDCTIALSGGSSKTLTAEYIACVPDTSTACYNNDIYWYDSCGRRGTVKEDCGNSGYSNWSNYCQDGDVWQKRTYFDRGCTETGGTQCFANGTDEQQFVESCSTYGCSGGQCLLPVTEVSLIADPNSGTEPLDVELTVLVGGTALGPIDYHLWWDCGIDTNDMSSAESSCGSLPSVSSGSCATNDIGFRCMDISNASQKITHTYLEGSHRAKVIVHRDIENGGTPAEASTLISVKGLFIPDKLPLPWEREDAGFAIFDIFTAALYIATPLFVVVMLAGAFQYITAAGNVEKLATTKKLMIYASIGYGTLVVTWAVVAGIQGVIF